MLHIYSVRLGLIYSMPPDHGAAVAAYILGNTDLKAEWMAEVDDMRSRVKKMRVLFVELMNEKAPNSSFGYIAEQKGMFSYFNINISSNSDID